MILERIQFEKEVKLLNLEHLPIELQKWSPDKKYKLQESGFRALIEGYATRHLLGGDLHTEEEMKRKFVEVSDPNNICVQISRKYINLLLNELPEYSKSELQILRKTGVHKDSIFIDDSLLSFVSEHIGDQINLTRDFEFGEYVIHHLSNYIFAEIQEEKLKAFSASLEKSQKSFNALIGGEIFQETKSLTEFDMRTLFAVFGYRFKPEKISPIYSKVYAKGFIKEGLKIGENMKMLKRVSQNIVNGGLGRRKRKGRRM